jgi:hypothetical protein
MKCGSSSMSRGFESGPHPSSPQAVRKCFEIGLSLAWIATPVLTDGVRKSKPTSSKTASKLAGFGNPAKQQGISKTLSKRKSKSLLKLHISDLGEVRRSKIPRVRGGAEGSVGVSADRPGSQTVSAGLER